VTAAFAGRPPAGDGDVGLPRLAARLPEPGHLWIRHAPRVWQGPERPWLDLAAGRLGRNSGREPAGDAALPGAPPDDLLYLPPVPARLAGWRDGLAARALAGGAPVLLQLLPGDETGLPPGGGAVVVIDLLADLLDGGGELATAWPWASRAPIAAANGLGVVGGADVVGAETGGEGGATGGISGAGPAAIAGGAVAVWPLVPGITDDPERWERSCARLAGAGFSVLQALVPALGPGDRRRLAQRLVGPGEGKAFEALFHRQNREPSSERELARVAHRHGLAPFLPRPLPQPALPPLPRPPLPRAENRRLAGLLALAGELWLRLGRPVEQAQALFRAARWLDGTTYDVAALCREGNLAVVTALDPLARRAVAEAAAGGEPALLVELMAEYLG
jgi:hypothetical protein